MALERSKLVILLYEAFPKPSRPASFVKASVMELWWWWSCSGSGGSGGGGEVVVVEVVVKL